MTAQAKPLQRFPTPSYDLLGEVKMVRSSLPLVCTLDKIFSNESDGLVRKA